MAHYAIGQIENKTGETVSVTFTAKESFPSVANLGNVVPRYMLTDAQDSALVLEVTGNGNQNFIYLWYETKGSAINLK